MILISNLCLHSKIFYEASDILQVIYLLTQKMGKERREYSIFFGVVVVFLDMSLALSLQYLISQSGPVCNKLTCKKSTTEQS